MFEVHSYMDPWRGRRIYYSIWKNGNAEVVPKYVDKYRAYRPLQQRPRDGTVVRNRTGGLKRVS